MENINCLICGADKKKPVFEKASGNGEMFCLVKCRECGLQFISPRPDTEEIAEYYELDYFSTRTDRGYDNYFSERIQSEIQRVLQLNLNDLGFPEFEKSLQRNRSVLDIGCAAGYSVDHFKKRSWNSMGVDVSSDCTDFAKKRGLDVINGDYLNIRFDHGFDLVTLWASIEHLHNPDSFLKKINSELNENGRLFISTCRTGVINFKNLYGKKWRFYNFPEHLYFFSYPLLKRLLENNGFRVINYCTYGSGTGSGGSRVRRISDYMAKKFYAGDMMLVGAVKEYSLFE